MKILLFGKNGQVGWELQRSLAPLGEVIALDAASAHYCGDLARPDDVAATIATLRPNVVVNAAAFTAVDRAEREADRARTVNALAPAAMAAAAQACGAWLVHYSSDYVFDGSGQRPWTETDSTGPQSVYGRSKLEGERLIQSACARHLILRTSWVYSARGSNFARTMLALASQRERLRVVDDQFGVPTGADLLADVTAHALRDVLRSADGLALAGLYHVAPSGETNWHQYARFVLGTSAALGANLMASADTVDAMSSAAYAAKSPSAAARPLNARLDTSKFRSSFGLHLPPWQDGVARMLGQLQQAQ